MINGKRRIPISSSSLQQQSMSLLNMQASQIMAGMGHPTIRACILRVILVKAVIVDEASEMPESERSIAAVRL